MQKGHSALQWRELSDMVDVLEDYKGELVQLARLATSGSAPDVRPCAIAFNKWDNRVVRHMQAGGFHGDLFAPLGLFQFLCVNAHVLVVRYEVKW